MEDYTTCGLWLLILLVGCGRLSAFNLDTTNVLRRDGDPGSLFGFSLAMHRQLSPEDKRMLLVGAPKAKALSKQKSKVTGGVYKCDTNPNSNACQRIDFDNDENLLNEKKENQWMGVSVASQGPGGKVLTCAHRYQEWLQVGKASESRNIVGRCYVLNQDLTITPGTEEGGSWHFCKGRPAGHQKFGSCQQGFSTTFDKNYHYLIFGAPGAHDWKGLVHLEQRNESYFEMGIFFDGPYETGSESKKDPNLVPVPDNSYLGFSLDTGNSLTKQGQLTVVAGAPRAYYSGAVVLLKKSIDDTQNMLEEYTLKGEGLASSFGYDLTVLDLNGDGWDDIVVGAPQYFEKDSEIGGAVYIYINKAGKWNEVKHTRIDGPAYSMFGLAVENLGDVDRDGYHDFAVGAPYDDSGVGKVYIYQGSATGEFTKKASQVLSGNSIGVKQFGYSLAGNMDLDRNSYPDLAVGSLSDSVFVYKARPVVNVEKVVTISPSKIDLSKKNCGDFTCLEVKACFSYTTNSGGNFPPMTVTYYLEADAERKKEGFPPRGKFEEIADQENSNMLTGVFIMATKGQQECFKHKLKMEEEIREKLLEMPIDISVKIQDNKRKRRQTQTQIAPVLDAKAVKPIRTKVKFLKEGCGSDDVCQSNLMLESYVYKAVEGHTFNSLEMENGVPMITRIDPKGVALEVTVTNPNGDDAYQASVIANFPRSVTYSDYSPGSSDVSCKANTNGSMATCELGNPFKRNSKKTFYIVFDTTSLSFNAIEVEIELKLKTASEQQNLIPVKAKAKIAITLQLSLSGYVQPSQVYFNKDVKGSTDIKTESDLGSSITHQFTINNRGKRLTDIGTATLYIEWPKMTKEDKYVLYLMKISSSELKQIECSPAGEINPLNMKPETRKRRATNQGIYEAKSRLLGKKKTLSCDSGLKCVTIKCPLGDLENKATITLNSHLQNNTFVEDFSEFHYTEVLVTASLHVDSTTKNTMMQDAETQVKMMVFPERSAARYSGVGWWIIFLSILFILLLLGLLAFLLWKCGVFQKNKDDPSDKEKLTSNA